MANQSSISAAPVDAPLLPTDAPPPPSKLKRVLQKIWWLHSFFALAFGAGVMLFARAGLAHADKVMMALLISWLVMFVALRSIVGPTNRRDHETIGRKGVRVVTNYIIKQFYQQMFFFLVPLYASSATWSLVSFNWWLAPLLLICAVVSTLDLVFDNYIMERRYLAAAMYGLAMFGVLNVLLPLVAGTSHLSGLVIAAAATPLAVALLSFPLRTVASSNGILVTLGATGLMLLSVWLGRKQIPPAPLAMPLAAVGHGTFGSYECLPGAALRIPSNQLDGLRCATLLREPGGLKEPVVHQWLHNGVVLLELHPERLGCEHDGEVFRSMFPQEKMPASPAGKWACVTMTTGGQLVGVTRFQVTGLTVVPPVPIAPGAHAMPVPALPAVPFDAR